MFHRVRAPHQFQPVDSRIGGIVLGAFRGPLFSSNFSVCLEIMTMRENNSTVVLPTPIGNTPLIRLDGSCPFCYSATWYCDSVVRCGYTLIHALVRFWVLFRPRNTVKHSNYVLSPALVAANVTIPSMSHPESKGLIDGSRVMWDNPRWALAAFSRRSQFQQRQIKLCLNSIAHR